jgi:hypothetical protein
VPNQDVLYKLKIDTTSAKPAFEELKREVNGLGSAMPKLEFKNLSELKNELSGLEKVRDNAFDFRTAKAAVSEIKRVESEIQKLSNDLSSTKPSGFFSSISQQAKGAVGSFTGIAAGGLAANLATSFLSGIAEKAVIADNASDNLSIALAKTGLSAGETTLEMQRLGKSQTRIAEDFAISKTEVASLQAKIAGFGNISGTELDKLTEFSIGAANALQLPAEAVGKLIAKSTDPEQTATLSKLGIVFEKNATAAEKMATIQAKLGPVVDATKSSTRDAVGNFERLKNTLEETTISVGSSLFEAIGPVFQVLLPVVTVIGTAIGDTMGAIGEALSPLGALFSGVGTGAEGFKTILTGVITYALFPLKLSIEGAALVIKGFVSVWQSAGTVISDIGNFFGFVSDIDTANAHASASLANVQSSFENYGKSISEVEAKVSEAKGAETQVAKLEELQKKTKLTADEQSELAKVTKELGDKFPEATSGINALTGGFDVNLSKLKDLSREQEAYASADKKKLIEENIWRPTKDLLPALDAQKAKLQELRTALDNAVSSGDTDKILELREAYTKQRDAIAGSEDQLKKNLEILVKNGIVGKGSTEEIAKGMNISTAEAAKLVPVVLEINKGLAEQAAEAKRVAESVEGLAEKYNEARAAEEKSLSTSKSALKELDREIASARGNTELTKQLQSRRAELVANAKEEALVHKQAAEEDKRIDSELGLVKETQRESAFAKRIKQIDTETKTLSALTKEQEAVLTKVAADEFTKGIRKKSDLSDSESKQLIQQRIDDQRRELQALQALANLDDKNRVISLKPGLSRKGEEEKDLASLREKVAALSLKLSKDEVDLVKLKPVLTDEEVTKFAREFQSGIDSITQKEIEVGIRPKDQSISLIDSQLQRLKDQYNENFIKLKVDPLTGQVFDVISQEFKTLTKEEQETQIALFKQLNQLTLQKLDLEKNRAQTTLALDKELRDARITNISDDAVRESEALKAKQNDELQYFRDREASGIALTIREVQLRAEIERRHLSELRELSKKHYREELDTRISLQRIASDAIIKAFKEEQTEKKKLSREETDDKQLGFDKERRSLENSLAKGEIDQREYNIKLAKLTKDRTDFETEQQSASSSRIVRELQKGLTSATEAFGKYFDTLFQKYVVDAALQQIFDAQKTASLAVGVQARLALNEVEGNSNLESARKTGIAGAAQAAANAMAALPFPLDIAAAIASSIAFSKIISGLTGLIKFEKGGLGLVGEKGPEIIGPTKDFSQFTSQLVTRTVSATERMLSRGNQSSASRPSNMNVRVSGKFTGRGRDFQVMLDKEELARKREVVMAG